MILYQPQNLKPYFARTLIKVFTAIIATMKANVPPQRYNKLTTVPAAIPTATPAALEPVFERTKPATPAATTAGRAKIPPPPEPPPELLPPPPARANSDITSIANMYQL